MRRERRALRTAELFMCDMFLWWLTGTKGRGRDIALLSCFSANPLRFHFSVTSSHLALGGPGWEEEWTGQVFKMCYSWVQKVLFCLTCLDFLESSS
jgi:hypothetical protein